MNLRKIVPVILGPTATGKTSIGIELANLLEGEIISVDSRKVYRGLPIGTATPEGHWTNGKYVVDGIIHHLISCVDPNENFTAGDFSKAAGRLINDIHDRGKTAILVGGTGFYFKALQKGLPQLPPRDETYRLRLMQRVREQGLDELHKELATVDHAASQVISRGDTHKIIRALEVWHLTGKPFSSWACAPRNPSPHHFVVMALRMNKDVLDRRIENRSQEMEKKGMVAETKALMDQGYSRHCAALMSFGFREAVQVLLGELPATQFLPLLIKGTKAYAKRQMTWFRTQVQPIWFDCDESSNKLEIALKMKDFICTYDS